jgi:pimeloyl-ACP methyl ester carboxylesterase
MIGNLSNCLRGKVRLVIITYPRTLTWSLDDYAAAVEAVLLVRNIRQGWLLAESFSSQVAWAIIGRGKFAVQGIIMAGGFVKHPMRWAVRPVGVLCRRSLLRWVFPVYRIYVKTFRLKGRNDGQSTEYIHSFIARRTDLDLQAMRHRLRLIASNDPRAIARHSAVPVFGLTGLIDPIVPWPFVRGWLRKHCPGLRDYQIIFGSDHTVLNMAAEPSARKILEWINGENSKFQ